MFLPDPIIHSMHNYYLEERIRMARGSLLGLNVPAWRRRVLHLAGELGHVLVEAGTSLQHFAQQS